MPIGNFVPIVAKLMKRGDPLRRKQQAKWMIIGAILTITGLHYATITASWPLHNFFRWLYYLPIILAAFEFKLKGGFWASFAVSLLYAPHMLFYFGSINLEVFNQLLEIMMFLIVGLMTGYLTEKDEQKRLLVEAQLTRIANLEDTTQKILDSLEDGVMALGQQLEIQSMNQKARELFRNPASIMTLFQAHGLVADLEDILTQSQPAMSREIPYQKEAGSIISLQLYGYPLKNRIGKIEGVVLLVQDKTEMKALEQQLKRTERLSAIGQFASGIAHEIRNPLAIVKTISQTIDPESDPAELKEALEIIQEEIDRANTVIKGLFDYAKPYELEQTPLLLNRVIEESILLLTPMAAQQQVNMSFSMEFEASVKGNADKLKQAIINLIMNGIQSMTEGGPLKIVLYGQEKNRVCIKISDKGSGMSEQVLNKIFDPFFTTKEKGIGLGLAITHRIIEEHCGTMEIVSQEGIGTEVVICLPLFEKED